MARPRDDEDDEEFEVVDKPAKKKPRRDDDDEFEVVDETPKRKSSSRRIRDDVGAEPNVYLHKRCREETVMPDEEIEKYLEHPFNLGEEPMTFCCACDEVVPWKECKWVETGENCYDYLDDLRAEMYLDDRDPRNQPGLQWPMPLIAAVMLAAAAWKIDVINSVGLRMGIGFAVGLIGGVIWMFIQRGNDEKLFSDWNRKLLARYYKRHPELKSAKSKRR
jgi:hypothetical protein